MTLCTSIDTLAMAYLDDELADAELRDFELHLLTCASCKSRVDTERAGLAELRARLAAPAAPDLLRARLAAALDREDREQSRSRVAGWILPGAASLAAIAALALFVLLPARGGEPDSVAADVVAHHVRAPEITAPMPVVAGANHDSIDLVATWTQRVRDRELLMRQFRLRASWGEAQIRVTRIDARGLDIEMGDRVAGEGVELWLVQVGGDYALIHRAPGDVGLMFTSEELSWQDLARVIERYDLAERMR